MSKLMPYETEADREARYTWTAEDEVELVHRGNGEAFNVDKLLNGVRATDSNGQGPEVQVCGLTCVIETPRGYVRHGKDFEIKLPYDYGYIRGVPGADGDSLDVCIGPEGNGWVYVIDQRHLDRPGFDEHKVFINWPSAKAAVAAFNAGHHRAQDVFMDWTPIPLSEFTHWLKTHDIRKPAGSVKK